MAKRKTPTTRVRRLDFNMGWIVFRLKGIVASASAVAHELSRYPSARVTPHMHHLVAVKENAEAFLDAIGYGPKHEEDLE